MGLRPYGLTAPVPAESTGAQRIGLGKEGPTPQMAVLGEWAQEQGAGSDRFVCHQDPVLGAGGLAPCKGLA